MATMGENDEALVAQDVRARCSTRAVWPNDNTVGCLLMWRMDGVSIGGNDGATTIDSGYPLGQATRGELRVRVSPTPVLAQVLSLLGVSLDAPPSAADPRRELLGLVPVGQAARSPVVVVLGETFQELRTSDAAGWRSLLGAYPWPIDEALLVIQGPTPACPNGESTGNPLAFNGQDYGLMGINAVHVDKLERVTGSRDLAMLFVPEVNIAVGYLVWLESGGGTWLPWSCRP